MSKILSMKVLPAGTYVIGDPCFLVGYDNAEEIMKSQADDVFSHTCARGDGLIYSDNQNKDYAVDTGWLSIIPWDENASVKPLTHVHTFKKEFTVKYMSNGVFDFGGVMINTGNDEYL